MKRLFLPWLLCSILFILPLIYLFMQTKPIAVSSMSPQNPISSALINKTIPGKTNKNKTFLTFFTSIDNAASNYVVYNNTVGNWKQLGTLETVTLVMFTNDSGVAAFCISKGWNVLPITDYAAGMPVLRKMYMDVASNFDSFFYAYANGDLLFTDKLIDTLRLVQEEHMSTKTPLMVVGIRTNVYNVSREESENFDNVTKVAQTRGEPFMTGAEDYFFTTKSYPWIDIPPFVIGRKAYGNWLVLNARQKGHIVIDASATVLAVHQSTTHGDEKRKHREYSKINNVIFEKLNNNRTVHYAADLTTCCTFMKKYNVERKPCLLKRDRLPNICWPLPT